MAQTIKIKRSTTTATPSTLSAGELAYSDSSDKLFIGAPADSAVIAIGGKVYIDMLDHTAGTLTADSAIVVDSNSKIDKLLTGNIRINNTTNQIDTASGNLILNPAASLDIDAGTIDLSTQATEFSIIDNSATAFTVSQGINNYITLDTTNSAEKIKFGQQVEFSGAYTLPTGDGVSGQALITDGSGTVSFTTISTELDIAADTGTDTISLVNDTLTFTGTDPVQTSINASTNTLSISVDDATSSTKGIASFSGSYYTVTSGDVAINDATTTTKGIASFSTDNFAVSGGAVTIKDGGVANAELVNDSITIGTDAVALGTTITDLNGLTSVDVDNLTLNGNEISSTDTNGNISLNPNGSGVVDVNNSRISNVTDPTQAQDAATKAYVDAVKQSLDIKDSVRVATTANITIASDLNVGDTIDGITLADGDRVLVKDQTTASQNGIYVAGSSPVRAADANTSAEVTSGMFVFVEEGTTNADNGFVLSTDGTITLDTTNLTFTQFSGAGQIVAGDALSKSGNTLNVNDDNITLEVSSDNLRIKGITTTAIGDLLIGKATNGGYSRLPKPSSDTALLTMGTAGTASWTTTLDGGTF